MKFPWRGAIGLALTVFLLWWVFRDTDPKQVGRALAGASIGMLILGGLLNLGHNVFRVWRWKALLEPVREGVSFRPLFAAVIVGYLTTWLVPGRLGEVVRPALLSARENVPLGPSLGTVVSDRILDGMTIVLLFAVGTLATQLPGGAAPHVAGIRTVPMPWALAVHLPLINHAATGRFMMYASLVLAVIAALWLARRHLRRRAS